MSNLRARPGSSKKSEVDGSISTRPQRGMMGSTSHKVVTLQKSASTFLRRKLTSIKTPTRASTLPATSSAFKTSKQSSASILHPTNLCENPRKILHQVADYFSQVTEDEVSSTSEKCSSVSTPACNSRSQSPLGHTTASTKSSNSCRGNKPGDLQADASPQHIQNKRARSQSEPTHKHKPTPFSMPFSCYSCIALAITTIDPSSKPNSFDPSPPLMSTSEPSPLSKEIVFKLEDVKINADPSLSPGSPKILVGPRTKKSNQKPLLAAARKNKFQKSSARTENSAKEILHQAIAAHQKNDMILSAILFEQCAKWNGGYGVGMLMWALALRHGWGCPVDTTKAFGWLQLCIETLLRELHQTKIEKQRHDDLQNLQKSHKPLLASQNLMMEIKGITSELLLALYELGQCLMYGWGCQRDKKMAAQYYRLAANLGDPDAQKEIAYCYEVGNGVKKSSQNAAKYYRMACAQGVKMMGYQWIWKEKYNPDYAKKKTIKFFF